MVEIRDLQNSKECISSQRIDAELGHSAQQVYRVVGPTGLPCVGDQVVVKVTFSTLPILIQNIECRSRDVIVTVVQEIVYTRFGVLCSA